LCDHQLLVGRNYQDFNLAVWRADPRGVILIVLRVNFDAEPFELIANHLSDLKGVFTSAGGEHEAVQSSPLRTAVIAPIFFMIRWQAVMKDGIEADHLRQIGTQASKQIDRMQVIRFVERASGVSREKVSRSPGVMSSRPVWSGPPWTTRWPTANNASEPRRLQSARGRSREFRRTPNILRPMCGRQPDCPMRP